MRTLRTRVAFPAEVHVEAFAPPPRNKLRDFAEAFGLGKTRITGFDPASPTGRNPSPSPEIQWLRPRGRAPDMITIDDPISRSRHIREAFEQGKIRLLPWQQAAFDEAKARK